MVNSDKLEKSRGVVIIANNTADTDYISIAEANARLVKQYLGLPTTVIETTPVSNRRFDTQTNRFVEWNNTGRYDAYNLSPYDETLLLDADYLILDNNLSKLFETTTDYTLFDKNTYINNNITKHTMGQYSLPFVWATAVIFKRTLKSEILFDLVAKIQRNYKYYRDLYNIAESNFRNDYAFAIADNILNGYSQQNFAPWSITTVSGPIDSLELRDTQLIVRTAERAWVLPKQNLHVMNKQYLQSNNFKNFIETACA